MLQSTTETVVTEAMVPVSNTAVYNSSDIPADLSPDVLIYGCTAAGLFAAARLLDPGLTQDVIRDDVISASASGDGNLTVIIMEPSGRCGGRLFSANSPHNDYNFVAELGDLGYESSPSSYSDVLISYLGLDVKEVDQLVHDSNLMYLRGRHLRATQETTRLADLYAMNYVEDGQRAADLLYSAVDTLLPTAMDMNETEWVNVFNNGYALADGTQLTDIGFLSALCMVMSSEALSYVTAYYGSDHKLNMNSNALEGILTVVLAAKAPVLKAPVDGMESLIVQLQQRVLDLGGLIALNAVMTDLTSGTGIDNITDTTTGSTTNVTAQYDVTFDMQGQDPLTLSGVRNVVFSNSIASHASSMDQVLANSDFFALFDTTNATNTTSTTLATNTNTNTNINSTLINMTDSYGLYSNVMIDLNLPLVLASRVPTSYARLYMCYDKPFWSTPVLDIKSGCSVTDSPLRSVTYLDHGCLMINTYGDSSNYWKSLYQGQKYMKMKMEPDWNIYETRWIALEAPENMIKEAQRQLQLLHNIPYIPTPVSSLYVSDDIVGDSSHSWVVGINPSTASMYLGRPNAEWNVFFIGESSGVAFPYQGLEADLKSAEDLVQLYFFTQPDPLTFDLTGELTSDQLSQAGLAVSSSADGTRVALVSTLPDDSGMSEVTVYQRVGDDFLGMWKSIGSNFVQGNTPVSFSLGGNSTSDSTTGRRRSLGSRRNRKLVERVSMANITSVAISGDGMTLAIGVVDGETGMGVVQIYKDSNMGNWSKYGEDLMPTQDASEFGFSVDLSFDGKTLAVGAPAADDYGAVYVYDCTEKSFQENMLADALASQFKYPAARRDAITTTLTPTVSMCTQIGKTMEGIDLVTRYGESVSLSYDGKVVLAGAPNTGANLQGYVAVFAFDTSKSDWSQVGSILEGREVDDQFGFSVSLSADGSALVVGAPGAVGTIGGGYAKAFRYDSQTVMDWLEIGLMEGETEGDNVGFSVGISGDSSRIIVGVPQLDSNNTGFVLAYEFNGKSYVKYEGTELVGEELGDMMGYSVSLSFDGTQVALGSPQAIGGQGLVKTMVYVIPEVGLIDPFQLIARAIWADATIDNPYEWLETDPCIESPMLKEDTTTAYAALVDGIIASLQDPRLNPDVEAVFTFNTQDNVPMGNCTSLLVTAEMIANEFDPTLDSLQLGLLEAAIRAYRATLVVDTLPPAPAPTPAPLIDTNTTDTPAPTPSLDNSTLTNTTDVGGIVESLINSTSGRLR